MTTNLRYENIIKKSSDELFSEYSVEELGQIIDKLSRDVSSKKQQLRSLVGNKYRDLLNVADDIIKMDTITTKQNEDITNLIFQKSNYNSKYLSNLSKFNNNVDSFKSQSLQEENMDKVFYNVVHDLSYLILCLKNNLNFEDQEDELIGEVELDNQNPMSDFEEFVNNYKTVSTHLMNDFVIIAKHIYLIDFFFKDLVDTNSSSLSVMQLNKSRNEFHRMIEFYISKLKHESDSDFILSLSLSYIISTKNDVDVIEWITSKRLDYFHHLAESKLNFQDLLNHVFTTIEFINTIKSRLLLLMNRAKNNNASSNWIRQTPFKKWEQWLNTESCDFKFQSNGFNKLNSENVLVDWKMKISKLLVYKFDNEFASSNKSLTHMVYLLKSILISFKNFTSLTSLPVGDDKIVNYIIEQWKQSFSAQLKVEINEFSVISKVVIETFNDEDRILKIHSFAKDTLLIDYSKNFNIDAFFDSLHTKNSSNEVFNLLDEFRTDLNSIATSVESLKALSSLVIKPVISIDDTEDEEFWIDVSKTLTHLLQTSVEESIVHLSQSINEFFDNLNTVISGDSVSNVKYFYIIRILTELEGKIRLKEFYETLNQYTEIHNFPVELNRSVQNILEKCFDIITKSVFVSIKPKLVDVFAKRLQHEYHEISLWETLDDKKIPTMCSIEIISLLLSYVSSLVKADNNTYANLFTLKAFEKSRINTIDLFLDVIKNFVEENETIDEDKLLITYADYIFIMSLKSDSEDDKYMESLFIKRLQSLEDIVYREKIVNLIKENYKTQYLMYFPLCHI